ncbi:MAG TPA: hypothetical protein VGL94_09105 [Ktedonobacteraceae bacterium]|jgi:hypothetical protein
MADSGQHSRSQLPSDRQRQIEGQRTEGQGSPRHGSSANRGGRVDDFATFTGNYQEKQRIEKEANFVDKKTRISQVPIQELEGALGELTGGDYESDREALRAEIKARRARKAKSQEKNLPHIQELEGALGELTGGDYESDREALRAEIKARRAEKAAEKSRGHYPTIQELEGALGELTGSDYESDREALRAEIKARRAEKAAEKSRGHYPTIQELESERNKHPKNSKEFMELDAQIKDVRDKNARIRISIQQLKEQRDAFPKDSPEYRERDAQINAIQAENFRQYGNKKVKKLEAERDAFPKDSPEYRERDADIQAIRVENDRQYEIKKEGGNRASTSQQG